MSTRARSLSELWNDPKQDEVLFVLQMIPDKRDKIVPGAGVYGIMVLPRFQDLSRVQPSKIYVALDTGSIKFWNAVDQECHVTLPQEIDLRILTGDEHSDSPKRRQVKEDIFNVARAHGYPFNITQAEISGQCRNSLSEAREIDKADPRLIPAVILSPNTAIVHSGVEIPLEQFNPSLYSQQVTRLLPIRKNAGVFRLHFSNKKRDDIIAQTATKKNLWHKTEVDLGVYYFQVTKENGIEIKDPKKNDYFPLYYRNDKGEYKICKRFQQMYLDRVAAIKMIALKKNEIEEKTLYPEDKYKKLWSHSDRDREAAFQKILEGYKNRVIPLTEGIEAKHAEQMQRYKERFQLIKGSKVIAVEKQRQLLRLREALECFVSQERTENREDFSSSVYDSLSLDAEIWIRDSINPEIKRLEEEAASEVSMYSVPEPMQQTGRAAQVDGYLECFQETIESEASILRKLQQLRQLKQDLLPFLSTASDKSSLEAYEGLSQQLMEDIRKKIRELRQEFRQKVIADLVLYLETIEEKNEKTFIIKLLIHLRSRADLPLIDVTEEENYFIVNCRLQYLTALKEEDLSVVLDENDKKTLENKKLLSSLISIIAIVPELSEVLLTQIIHSNVAALEKLQRLNRLKESLKPFYGNDAKTHTIRALLSGAMEQCREAFLNLESIQLLQRFLADLDVSDCTRTTRITFLGWSAQVPIASSETKMAETTLIKVAALKIMVYLKLWVGIPRIALNESELDTVNRNAGFLENGTLLGCLAVEERDALQDSELRGILAGIVYEVPELQSVLCGVLENEQAKQNRPHTSCS